jgi:hypothetical protein
MSPGWPEPVPKYVREFFTQHEGRSLKNHKFVINEVLYIPANRPDENSKVDIVGFHVLEYRNNTFHEKTRIGQKLK